MIELEKWITIPGTDGLYKASSHGNIRHVRRSKNLKAWTNWNGYKLVEMRKQKYAVHRMVALSFHGPCPENMECCHLDGNKNNNSPHNLKYVKRRENHSHKVKHGTQQIGENGSNAKLKTMEVIEILNMRAAGKTLKAIGLCFGVSASTVSCIVRRKTWTHLFNEA